MPQTPNLILVGPMGAGKTTIGRRLAKILNKDFVDSDEEIERRTGVDIPLIFEVEGEAGFRARESKVLAELCERPRIVLATGGGSVLAAENRRCLSRDGFVVYLRASADEQMRRIRHDTNRPMMQAADPRARLAQLTVQRDPLYREVADLIVDTDVSQVKHSIGRILRRYRKHGE